MLQDWENNGPEPDQYRMNSGVEQRAPQTSYGFNHVDMISYKDIASNKHTAELPLFFLQTVRQQCVSVNTASLKTNSFGAQTTSPLMTAIKQR